MTAPADRTSRHADLPTYRREVDPAGPDVRLYTPRLRAEPPATTRHRVAAGERLDLVAYQYYGDPHQYWRIADANPAADVDALEEPGLDLGIPDGA